jgi:hypothetical protein
MEGSNEFLRTVNYHSTRGMVEKQERELEPSHEEADELTLAFIFRTESFGAWEDTISPPILQSPGKTLPPTKLSRTPCPEHLCS